MNLIRQIFLNPLKGRGFIYLLLLNIISNMAVLYLGVNQKTVFYVVSVSFIAAYFENAVVRLMKAPIIKNILYSVWSVFHNILIIVDYYLIYQFGRIFNQDIVDLLFETNGVEINNFVETYLTAGTILPFFLIIVALNVSVYILAVLLSKVELTLIWGFGTLMGIGVYLLMAYSYIVYKDGKGITQYNTIVRVSHSFMILNKTLKTIDELTHVCRDIEATQTFADRPSVVLIIGESASIYHSALYGYEKETTPLIAERVINDSLVVFDDIVSVADVTHKAMGSIFSFSKYEENFEKTPLFPAVFKSVGYHTAMYDNQYFRGQGVTFMSDKELSDLMFDYRNENRYEYDGDMVESIQLNEEGSLYVIHLWGQHYTYAHRYPKAFAHFKADEYDAQKYSSEKREIIAHYDNATLYNDYVLNAIIERFENLNCVVIYLSDHGEEVYELGNFMGHGGAAFHDDITYLVRVPFWIWMSQKYKDTHPDKAQAIYKAKDLPGITDDVSHLLMDIVGINMSFFSPSRSLINSDYDVSKPRIVLNSIEYKRSSVSR